MKAPSATKHVKKLAKKQHKQQGNTLLAYIQDEFNECSVCSREISLGGYAQAEEAEATGEAF